MPSNLLANSLTLGETWKQHLPIQDITFCIKTIHRPWACHRLVQSLRKEFVEPKIVVVDDGLPEYWFSRKYPETAKHCKVIDLSSTMWVSALDAIQQ